MDWNIYPNIQKFFVKSETKESVVEVSSDVMAEINSEFERLTTGWISYAVNNNLNVSEKRPEMPYCMIKFGDKTVHFKLIDQVPS